VLRKISESTENLQRNICKEGEVWIGKAKLITTLFFKKCFFYFHSVKFVHLKLLAYPESGYKNLSDTPSEHNFFQT